MKKRLISMLLVLTMFVSAFPVTAFAANGQENPQVEAINDDYSIEGTNGFGSLLAEDLKENEENKAEAAADYPAGYTITDLVIEGNIATVTYDALEEAVIVVGIYTEDNLQLLASGRSVISPNEKLATVIIEDEMPEYFQAEAFMLDTYDSSPLSATFHTPMYTKEMQELLASTVDDYDPDKVLNLDEDETTNFAVFAEDTIIIEEQEGVNTVTSANDETATYVIENADKQITSLKKGDVFAYPYGDNEMLIIKVGSIEIDGTTVTITGADLEMEEAFEAVKIETDASAEEFEVDESVTDVDLVFTGMGSNAEPLSRTREKTNDKDNGSGTDKKRLNFDFLKDIKGTLGLDIELDFDFYVKLTSQHVSFRVNLDAYFQIALEKAHEGDPLELPEINLSPVPGLYIGFSPKLIFEFSASFSGRFSIGLGFGFTFDSSQGFQRVYESPETNINIKGSIGIKVGFDLNPTLGVVGKSIISLSSELAAGLIIECKTMEFNSSQVHKEEHLCQTCYEIDTALFVEITPKLAFLPKITKLLTFEAKPFNMTFDLWDGHFSLDFMSFHLFKPCPYYGYKVTVEVIDQKGEPVNNVDVTIGDEVLNTGKGNTVSGFLPNGPDHTITAITEEGYQGQTTIRVHNYPMKAVIKIVGEDGAVVSSGNCGPNLKWRYYNSGLLEIYGNGRMFNFYSTYDTPWYGGEIKKVEISDGATTIGEYAFANKTSLTNIKIPNSVTSIGDYAFANCTGLTDVYYDGTAEDWEKISIGYSNAHLTNANIHFKTPVDSGECGENVTWKLYDDGTLEIIGIGDIDSYKNSYFDSTAPWNKYKDRINLVNISNGVTRIGDYAFYHCNSLISIQIPESVTYIGRGVFDECESLTSVQIPRSVTYIGGQAFSDCNGLEAVYITDIAAWCNIEFVGPWANPLYYARKLYINGNLVTELAIPDSVTSIGEYAFEYCGSLTSVEIPVSVTSIGEYAFGDCWSLTNVEIPDSITSIGAGAFSSCRKLISIELPDNIKCIEGQLFLGCDSLTSVKIPNGVTSIGWGAFRSCDSLTSVEIPVSVTSIDECAFQWNDSLVFVNYTGTEEQWKEISISRYNAPLTSATIFYIPFPTIKASETQHIVSSVKREVPVMASAANTRATHGGKYETEVMDEYTMKTVTFTDLVPGAPYVMLDMVNSEAEDLLAADNLLNIKQGVADEDGNLTFQYVQRVSTDISYVIACGASNKNLKDATITFSEMIANGEAQIVDPIVVYDGETLIEEKDYIVLGTVEFTDIGEYTCIIRGVNDYTGSVECTYTVEAPKFAQNTTTGERYESVADAIRAAKNGETISLINDTTEEYFYIPEGVTLDLNGKVLTITDRMFVSYGEVIDGTDGSGGLKITSSDATILQPGNTTLPIYDSENSCYRFFTYEIKCRGVNAVAGNTDAAKYGYTLYFNNVEAYTLLATGENTNLNMSISLSWTGMSNAISYTVPTATLIQFANTAEKQMREKGKVTAALTFTVKGLNNLESGTVVYSSATIASTTNVTMTSETVGYTVA